MTRRSDRLDDIGTGLMLPSARRHLMSGALARRGFSRHLHPVDAGR
ncbi:hypothetical protein BLA14095_01178 [Burkholderia lata]|nr:hypothetical protein BLA14095_01178 [Burkholderia lata]